jgi:hypothetical protein
MRQFEGGTALECEHLPLASSATFHEHEGRGCVLTRVPTTHASSKNLQARASESGICARNQPSSRNRWPRLPCQGCYPHTRCTTRMGYARRIPVFSLAATHSPSHACILPLPLREGWGQGGGIRRESFFQATIKSWGAIKIDQTICIEIRGGATNGSPFNWARNWCPSMILHADTAKGLVNLSRASCRLGALDIQGIVGYQTTPNPANPVRFGGHSFDRQEISRSSRRSN